MELFGFSRIVIFIRNAVVPQITSTRARRAVPNELLRFAASVRCGFLRASAGQRC
jgi:hypothetical protein|tara:strand:+ start:1692 stop:1856 length:165 start_codon:yes stop_codon:yes gene_type:complete